MKKTKRNNQRVKKDRPKVNEDDLLRRITIDAKVLVGKPTIRGMRISVEQIINLLGQGMTHGEILAEYPVLEEEDIRAALRYAHLMLNKEKVYRVGSAG
jgi:uncharacterized protein (DUF433 family)